MKQHSHLIGILALFTFLIVGLGSQSFANAAYMERNDMNIRDSHYCPTGYNCAPIPYVRGCPFGYICTPKPLGSFKVSAMSCAAYVNANKIPTFTFTGKPTGGSGEYTYALWNSSGKLANIPSSEVPGSWKYDHQLGSSTDSYIVVTSGTTTANVLCGYS
jgi:hypothetical protein